MKEYQSREYCKDIDCYIQREKERAKLYWVIESCKKHCRDKCDAYKFHDWLQNNGYKIVKED